MISAQNLLQPLNGNKLITLLSLFSMIWLSSCELFKKVEGQPAGDKKDTTLEPIQGNKVFDPVSGTYVEVQSAPAEKMDTIKWADIPESTYPPITSTGDIFVASSNPEGEVIRTDELGSKFLTSYNVSILLPFITERFATDTANISATSQPFLNFYGGAKLALEELDGEAVKLSVEVLDSKASESRVSSLTNMARTTTATNNLNNAHLIIGPYRAETVKIMADFAKRKQINMVSPFSKATGLSPRNPFYLQVGSTLKTHCEAITQEVLRKYLPENVILVGRKSELDKDPQRFQYFQAELARLTAKPENRFQEYIINDEGGNFNDINVLPLLQFKDTTVFIVPSFSSETFIYSLLRKIDLSRNSYAQVAVYGLPQWMSFETNMDFELYERLNVHVSSSEYTNPLEERVKFFKSKYFDRYHAIPTQESYLGYDVMLYFGRMLQKYGTLFQYSLEKEPYTGLSIGFDMERIPVVTPIATEAFGIEQFENKKIFILKFQDYQFQPVNND